MAAATITFKFAIFVYPFSGCGLNRHLYIPPVLVVAGITVSKGINMAEVIELGESVTPAPGL